MDSLFYSSIYLFCYENKLKISSNKFKSSTKKLSSDWNLKKNKNLNNNTIKKYNEKRKNEEIINFQSSGYKKKINNLKNEVKKKSYLSKISSEKIKNSIIRTKSPYLVKIKRNNPYSFEINNIKEEKIKKTLNDIINSFIQTRNLEPIELNILTDYSSLIRTIDENYTKVKDFYIKAHTYLSYGSYLLLNDYAKGVYKNSIEPSINQLISQINDAILFYESSRNDMRERLNNLQLQNDKTQNNLYDTKLSEFKSKTEEILSKARSHLEDITKINGVIFDRVAYYMKYVTLISRIYFEIEKMYKKKVSDYVNRNSLNSKVHEDFLKEVENFLNIDNIANFKQNKCYKNNIKYKIKLLMEEISDIQKIYKENFNSISKNHDILVNCNKSMTPWTVEVWRYSWRRDECVANIFIPMNSLSSIQILEECNRKLREKFEKKKKDISDLFTVTVKELEGKINSLVYPEDLELESEKNISSSQEIINNVKLTISENSRSLEDLSNNYRSAKFSSIKNKLAQLYAEVIVHNDNMISIFDSMNEKNNYIKSSKNKIENLKSKRISTQEGNIEKIIDGLSNIIENVESEITLIKSKFDALNQNYLELQEFKDKIDQLKTTIQGNNDEIQRLKREEDESKRKIIEQIEQELEKINIKITDLNEIMGLKEKENKDLKIIEKLINGASCDMNKYIEKKKEANEKINLALNALISNGKLEACREISHFVNEKKKERGFDYTSYDLDDVNKILEEVKEKSTRIDSISSETTSIMENDVKPEINNISQLKNDIIIKLTEDLYSKMKDLLENFNKILDKVSRSISEYEAKKEILESYEHNMIKKKNEFLNKLIEEDNEILEEENIFQEMYLQSINSDDKNEINKQIANAQDIIITLKEQLDLCKNVEVFFDKLSDTKIDNFKALKLRINQEIIDNLDEYQERFNNITSSIESSIETINLSKKVIETLKNLNNIINESNNNRKSIEELSRNINIIKEKINEEMDIINKETLIGDMKTRFLNNLENKKGAIEEKKIEIDNLGEELILLLKYIETLKESNGKVKFIGEVEPYLKNALSKKRELIDIVNKIEDIKLTNDTLNKEINDIIKSVKAQIIESIYGHIINLNQEINNEVNRNLDILNQTKQTFENSNFEINVKEDKMNNNKQEINSIVQKIKHFISKIDDNKEKLTAIQSNSKEQVVAAHIIKENNKNFNGKKSNMKSHYEEIKKFLDELNTVKNESKSLIKDVNALKLEYERSKVYEIVQLISDEKRKSEEDMLNINVFKNKIEDLKKNTAEFIGNELRSFNYEEYLNKAKKNQEQINQLEKKANTLKEEASNSEIKDVENIKMKVEQKMKDIMVFRSEIYDSSNEIKNMENLLMMTKFKSIMDDIKNNIKKAREENANLKSKLKKLDNTNKLILDNFQKSEQLKGSITSNSEETVINESVDEIRKIKELIVNNIRNMGIFSIEVEKSKGASLLYFHNIVRGKNKIDYLKNHDQDKEKKITKNIIDEIDGYIHESEGYSNEANNIAQTFNTSYEIILNYENKIRDLLNESLILAEKIKIEKAKDDAESVMKEIQNVYSSSQKLLDKSKEKLNELNVQTKNIKEHNDEINNEKSMNALGEIEIIIIDINSILSDIETIKKDIQHILNTSENEMELFSTIHESKEKDLLSRLKKEQDNLRNALKFLKKIKNEKDILNQESSKIADIESKINSIENKLETNKKSYEEGILQKIKKLADQDKEYILRIKNSINLIIDISNSLFKKSTLKENDIRHLLEDYENKMEEIENNFNKSYKAIEIFLVEVTKSSISYEEAKNKREKSQMETKNLHERKEEMKILLNDINNSKNNLTLKLITSMEKDLNKINEKSEKDYSKVKEYLKEIEKYIENIKGSDDVNIVLKELDKAKNKDREIKEIKKNNFGYKNEADIIYSNIIETAKFIDMHLETKTELDGYKVISNSKEIISKIQNNSNDIDNKEKESKDFLTKANSLYEQIKLRDELIKIINETKQKLDDTSYEIESSFNKFKKIKEINVHDVIYDEIFKNYKDYKNLQELKNSFKERSSRIEKELKIDEIRKYIDYNKNSINYIEKIIYTTKGDGSSTNILEQARFDINILVNNVNNIYNNILEVNSSLDEILKVGKNYELSILLSIISILDVEISKDILIIKKKENDIALDVEYVRNNYNSINSDIDILNEYSTKNKINKYASNHVEEANLYEDNFKEMEQKVVETIDNMKEAFLTMNNKKNEDNVNEYLQELKILYKQLKNEKKHINDIYRNMNNVKLKEMEKKADKLMEMAKLYKNITDTVKQKLLDYEKKLKQIEDSIREKEHELLCIEYMSAQLYIQKVNETCEEISDQINKISEFENDNDENNKIIKYEGNIINLIERTNFLLDKVELYQYEKDYDLSEEENNKRLSEVNNYIEVIKKKTNESKKEFEDILNNIKQIKETLFNKNYIFHDIYSIIKNINEIKENSPKKAIEKDIERKIKNHLNEIKIIINENRNDIYKEINDTQNDNEQLKSQQLIIKNILKKIKEEKKKMDELFSDMLSGGNSNTYPNIKAYLEEAEKLIKELVYKIDQIESLIKGNNIEIEQLKDRNNIMIKKTIMKNSKHDKQKQESDETGDNERNSKGKNKFFNTKTAYVGGILCCLFVCSSIAFVFLNEDKCKENNSEKINLFDNRNDNDYDIHKEEIIDVIFEDEIS
ncbi:reticulocyte binding protein, putative [Plasmodium relictum]|uniref:Reticulocyte binding protein, putative n=1 Tax=Plasmodium relictum TaxID=85471 RepID=A0A1J1GKM3_PLARL|nr:reticulocyte binding protein, putative [Plasmodium relictum]CRG84732.1 reticulocyte binding protein, putative [Plasmodium relictum]